MLFSTFYPVSMSKFLSCFSLQKTDHFKMIPSTTKMPHSGFFSCPTCEYLLSAGWRACQESGKQKTSVWMMFAEGIICFPGAKARLLSVALELIRLVRVMHPRHRVGLCSSSPPAGSGLSVTTAGITIWIWMETLVVMATKGQILVKLTHTHTQNSIYKIQFH